MTMAIKPVTVSQLNEYISRVLGTDPLLSFVTVRGEIEGIKYHASGHVYFSIADEASRINCFLPREKAAGLKTLLENGDSVVITGGVSVYKKTGSYSIYVREIEPEGAGAAATAFDELKAKLEKEGLFSRAHKKNLPEFPHKIGLVTSDTGAALRDMLSILDSRNRLVDIVLFPVLVQGDSAAADITRTINYIDENVDDIDVLIVGRGGGAPGDLACFNDEALARAIYKCHIPVISAVGHEIDFTIADFVADVRAETPTAAAQLAAPDTAEIMNRLKAVIDGLKAHASNKLMYETLRCDNLIMELKSSALKRIGDGEKALSSVGTVLSENNPEKILKSGYSIVTKDGKAVSSSSELSEGDRVEILFGDGRAKAEITGV